MATTRRSILRLITAAPAAVGLGSVTGKVLAERIEQATDKAPEQLDYLLGKGKLTFVSEAPDGSEFELVLDNVSVFDLSLEVETQEYKAIRNGVVRTVSEVPVTSEIVFSGRASSDGWKLKEK